MILTLSSLPALWLLFTGPPMHQLDARIDAAPPVCEGVFKQGGLVRCEAEPGTLIKLSDGRAQTFGETGAVAFGLRTDAAPALVITMTSPRGETMSQALEVAPREDPLRIVEGLDCDKVDARTPEQKQHAGESWVKKQDAFASFDESRAPPETWLRPSAGRMSSPFGPQRKYIGVSAITGEPCESFSVHRGYDVAAPVGTEIVAPAGGTVLLADLDLYYEGGTIFLDHGGGLVSVFMHMSAIDVAAGDTVAAGDRLGATGNTGRTTGPHLHWGVKWRDPTREDRKGDFYIDPALLLGE